MDEMRRFRNNEKYGEAHKNAKRERLDRVGYKCEITGETENLESHHVQPKSLDIGTENNLEFASNHMELVSWFHKALHEAAHVGEKNRDLLMRRMQYAKRLWKNPEDEVTKIKLRDADEVLIKAFIDNMLNNLSHQYREKVINATLVSYMETNRDIKIEIRKRDIEIEALQRQIDELKSQQRGKIIDITQYHAKQE